MSDPYEDDYDDQDDCWNCGGEGVIYNCFDGFCVNAEDGCDDCARRCDVCHPLTLAEQKARAALREVMAAALTDPPRGAWTGQGSPSGAPDVRDEVPGPTPDLTTLPTSSGDEK